MPATLSDLLDKASSYLSEDRLQLVEQAYDFAAAQHEGQVRKSGEPYIEHPLNAALFLADLQQDSTTLAAALLHDVIEDCGMSREELSDLFGPEVSRLVDGVTKLTRLDLLSENRSTEEISDSHAQAESIRKMLVAMAEDVRVVVIKLADPAPQHEDPGTTGARTGSAPFPRKRWTSTRRWHTGWACGTSSGSWRTSLSERWDPDEYKKISRLAGDPASRAGGVPGATVPTGARGPQRGRSRWERVRPPQEHLQHLPEGAEVRGPGQGIRRDL